MICHKLTNLLEVANYGSRTKYDLLCECVAQLIADKLDLDKMRTFLTDNFGVPTVERGGTFAELCMLEAVMYVCYFIISSGGGELCIEEAPLPRSETFMPDRKERKMWEKKRRQLYVDAAKAAIETHGLPSDEEIATLTRIFDAVRLDNFTPN
jgi:hypothetical protein